MIDGENKLSMWGLGNAPERITFHVYQTERSELGDSVPSHRSQKYCLHIKYNPVVLFITESLHLLMTITLKASGIVEMNKTQCTRSISSANWRRP